MKTLAFLAVSALVIALGAGAGYLAQRYPLVDLQSAQPAAAQAAPPVSLAPQIAMTRQFFADHRLLAAQALLTDQLQLHPDAVDAPAARDLLGYINRWLFFAEDNEFGKTVYTVKRGDSLWRIARKLKTTPEELARLNKLKSPVIHPGQRLSVPDDAFKVTIDLVRERVVVRHQGSFVAEYPIVAADVPSSARTTVETTVKEASLRKGGEKLTLKQLDGAEAARLWIELERSGYVLYAASEPAGAAKLPAYLDLDVPTGGIKLARKDLRQLGLFVDRGTPVTILREKPGRSG
jgi:hypothetical protein